MGEVGEVAGGGGGGGDHSEDKVNSNRAITGVASLPFKRFHRTALHSVH